MAAFVARQDYDGTAISIGSGQPPAQEAPQPTALAAQAQDARVPQLEQTIRELEGQLAMAQLQAGSREEAYGTAIEDFEGMAEQPAGAIAGAIECAAEKHECGTRNSTPDSGKTDACFRV